MDISLIEAAKYGAAGIAVVGLVISGGLLKSALGKKKLNREAQTLIFSFMAFSGLMVAALIGLEVFQPKADDKLQTIRSLAHSIDTSVETKALYDSRIRENSDLRDNLKHSIDQICTNLVAIGREVGDLTIGSTCKRALQSM